MPLAVAIAFALGFTTTHAAEQPNAAISAATRGQLKLNIAAQPITDALNEFARQSGLQVFFLANDQTRQLVSTAIAGTFEANAALTRLLGNTGLSYKYLDERTVAIASGDAPAGNLKQKISMAPAPGGEPLDPAIRTPHQAEGASRDADGVLTEVIVTAQKRNERLQDVPVPVTAIDADVLVAHNQVRLHDYYTSIPGFNVIATTLGSSQALSVRGITTTANQAGNPTVGITVDDVPYGASTAAGGSQSPPDIDPAELARIELLRGPQGTLYGASSMGGLLKFVTVDPSTDGVNGRVQADTSSIQNGDEPGYSVRGSINLPVTDTLAVRAGGLIRRDAGYVGNPARDVDGVNSARTRGARLSALWQPSDVLSFKLSAQYQETELDGSADSNVLPGLTDLQQDYVRGAGGGERKVQAYSATVKAQLGPIDLTALTGYNVNEFSDSMDYTWGLGPMTQAYFGVPGTVIHYDSEAEKLTQEIRFSGALSSRVGWLVGVFYTEEESQYVSEVQATDSATGATVGSWSQISFPSTFEEYATFTDLTFHVTDRFDVQVGGRAGHIEQTTSSVNIGPLVTLLTGVPSPLVHPKIRTKANAYTYLLTPRFKVSPDLMVYARLASGYRAGGPNVSAGVPRQFEPDTTQNYEVGLKGDFLRGLLTVDASVYYIDWRDIQVGLHDAAAASNYIGNAGRAKSQGVELALTSRPARGLRVAGWIAWSDARLTEAFPATSSISAAAGDRLPYGPRWSGNVALDQEFPLTGALSGFVGGTLSYVGERHGEFVSGPPRQILDDYVRADLRAGVRSDAWTANLFVNNVADERGAVAGGIGNIPPFAWSYIQPRTVGISLSKTF